MDTARLPYYPDPGEWCELFGLLCEFCRHLSTFQVVEGMNETKDGKPWPEGGWVTDPGAGVTCLSYAPIERPSLSSQEIHDALAQGVPVCTGCAAQKGSEASVSLYTQRNFAYAVKHRARFTCHAEGQRGKPCGGWCQAVKWLGDERSASTD
ncbi:hypothetical protein [Vreelandella massiliensis]|uniref:hypothetical protein n=1 Tax=Vreelandella massiliensis TaxID=1816686 RepID=UPI00096A8EF4|nr:hypothetical protein [Halomonas massiliensis]